MGLRTENKPAESCTFLLAGAGVCTQRQVPGKGFCSEHLALRCTVCGKRQAKRACDEPTVQGYDCNTPICSSVCQEVHLSKAHNEPVNLEEVAIRVTFADGTAQWFRVPTARLGQEIALINPHGSKPCRCLYAYTKEGVLYYAEATGRSRPPPSAQMQQPAPPVEKVKAEEPAQPVQPVQESRREQIKHGTNLLTAFSLHVGYLLSICEQNNPFIHDVLASQSPGLRAELEKILTEVTIAILKGRDG